MLCVGTGRGAAGSVPPQVLFEINQDRKTMVNSQKSGRQGQKEAKIKCQGSSS